MKERDYSDYLQDILDSIVALEEFVSGMKFKDFKNDKKTLFAAIRCFEVIGEATKNISKTVRNKYPDIVWNEMAGMRDKLIHEYFGVDAKVLWKTVKKDIPPLKTALSKVVQDLKSR
jgi:uncharacterized protein with HEPN domain